MINAADDVLILYHKKSVCERIMDYIVSQLKDSLGPSKQNNARSMDVIQALNSNFPWESKYQQATNTQTIYGTTQSTLQAISHN